VCLHKAEYLSPSSTLVQPSFGFLQQQSLQFCSPLRWYTLNSKFLRWSDNNKTEDEFFTMHCTTSEHDPSMSSGCLSGMHKEQIRCIPNLFKMGNDLILGPVGSGKNITTEYHCAGLQRQGSLYCRLFLQHWCMLSDYPWWPIRLRKPIF